MARLAEATDAPAISKVRELFTEYARLVDEPCCFADFDRELDSLPGEYRLFLLEDAAGCVALRFLTADTAEMKRLYVRGAHRGRGLGRVLAETAIAAAREAGCARVVLDTRSEEHTSELQSQSNLVCRRLLEKKKQRIA